MRVNSKLNPKSRCFLERNPAAPILAGFLDKENGFGVALFKIAIAQSDRCLAYNGQADAVPRQILFHNKTKFRVLRIFASTVTRLLQQDIFSDRHGNHSMNDNKNEMKMKPITKPLLLLTIALGCLTPRTAGQAQEIADTLVSTNPGFRRALIEEFTGIHCPNCPAGHKEANLIQETYPDECFVINIHAGKLAVPNPGEVDLRSAYGEALATQAGVTGIPCASVNRHLFAGQSVHAMYSNYWFDAVEEILDMETYVNIGAEATIDWQSRELNVTVQLYYTGEAPAEGNRIHVAIVQNYVEGTQSGAEANPDQILENGKYLHQHVLRDLVTGLEGDLVETGTSGTLLQRTYSKILPEALNQLPMDIMDLQVIVFVSEAEGEVMDACEAPISFVNGPEYVFEMSGFEQAAQNTCDNLVRLGFELKNRNAEDRPVEEVTVLFSTPQGQEHEYVFAVAEWDESGICQVESDAVPVDETGVEDTLFVQVVAVNGEALTQFQEPVAVPVLKEYVSVGEPGIVLDLWQDRWGSEINWVFRDEKGDTLAKEDSYPDLPANGTEQHTYDISLSKGCNTFVIHDLMNDGINSGLAKAICKSAMPQVRYSCRMTVPIRTA